MNQAASHRLKEIEAEIKRLNEEKESILIEEANAPYNFKTGEEVVVKEPIFDSSLSPSISLEEFAKNPKYDVVRCSIESFYVRDDGKVVVTMNVTDKPKYDSYFWKSKTVEINLLGRMNNR